MISRSDWSGEVEDLYGEKVRVYAQSETSYGEAAGLFGVNCKHYPMTFIPGFSALRGEPQDPEENAEAYALSQEQRKLERRLREEKRDLEVMRAQGAGEEQITAQKARVSAASAEIEAFCEEHDLPRHRNRESTPVRATWPDENGGSVTRFNGNEYIDANRVPPEKGDQTPGAEDATRDTHTSVYYSERASYKVELSSYSKEVNAGLSEAIRDVAKKGTETGFEHMHLVNLKTGKLDFYETNKSSDSVGYGFREYLKANPDGQYAFVHNHNTDGSLSAADVRTLVSNPQIPVMVAARNDGVVYVAERKDGVLVNGSIEDLYLEALEALRADLKRGIITPAGYAKRMERIIVDNILRDYTKGGRLIEYDTRGN